MPQQTYRFDPAQKYFNVNQDFSGGMNSVDADTTMPENQLRLIENMELTTKGSLVKREGFSRVTTVDVGDGELQGHFQYFDKDRVVHNIYVANGSFYLENSTTHVVSLMQYWSLDLDSVTPTPAFVDADTFQKTKLMNAVVYDDIMLIATGNFLLEYGLFVDVGSSPETQSYYLRQMEWYMPTALEYSKIGANLLSDDPYNFIADSIASVLINDGIITTHRTATLNIPETIETFIGRPTGASVYIKTEVQKVDDTTWIDANNGWQLVDFSTKANKKIDYQFPEAGSFNIKSSVTLSTNISGQTITDATKVYTYMLSAYEVTLSEDIEDDRTYTPQICTNLLLYFDQIIMWGDTTQPNALYISDVFKPSYIPSDNVLLMETQQEDEITSVVYFYNVLVIFTNNNIFKLMGTTPADFSLGFVNRVLGCVAPNSAVAVGNNIIFLSQDGIYKLKTLSTLNLENFNVDRIDRDVWTSVPKPYDVFANAVQSGQAYILTFPTYGIRLKWYYEQDVWAIDRSVVFDYKFSRNILGEYYGYRPNGHVLIADGASYKDDDELITCVIETKENNLGYPLHPKKFKVVKFNFMNDPDNPTTASLTVSVDSAKMINPEQYLVTVDDDNQVVWEYTKLKNITLFSGSKYGSWILGSSKIGAVATTINKYNLTGRGYTSKIRIEHTDNTDFGLLGYAYVFKIKKP